jgi:hypothetical protein
MMPPGNRKVVVYTYLPLAVAVLADKKEVATNRCLVDYVLSMGG